MSKISSLSLAGGTSLFTTMKHWCLFLVFRPFPSSFARLPNLAVKDCLIFGLDLAIPASPYFLP
jgi:hypothetical protein